MCEMGRLASQNGGGIRFLYARSRHELRVVDNPDMFYREAGFQAVAGYPVPIAFR
jgi:hypothetical protein